MTIRVRMRFSISVSSRGSARSFPLDAAKLVAVHEILHRRLSFPHLHLLLDSLGQFLSLGYLLADLPSDLVKAGPGQEPMKSRSE